MDGTGYHDFKGNKTGSEREMLHVFSHMQNLDFFKRHESRRGNTYKEERDHYEEGEIRRAMNMIKVHYKYV
jgi:hypothetical protein